MLTQYPVSCSVYQSSNRVTRTYYRTSCIFSFLKKYHICLANSFVRYRWGQALTMLLRALSVPEMPMHVQLERSIEAAILCEGMGLKVCLLVTQLFSQ